MKNKRIIFRISSLFFLILAGMIFASCHASLADYPHNVQMKRFSDSSNLYILYWDDDDDASKYTIYTQSSSYISEYGSVTDNYYILTSSTSYYDSYAITKTVDGNESYISNFLSLDDADSHFTSIEAERSSWNSNYYTLSWEKLPAATEYVIYGRYATNPNRNDLERMFDTSYYSRNGFPTTNYAETIDTISPKKSDVRIDEDYYYAVYARLRYRNSLNSYNINENYYYLITEPIKGEDLIDSDDDWD